MKQVELFNDHWRDIPSYEGYYQASKDGMIRSCDRRIKQKGHQNNYERIMRGQILKPRPLNSGYLIVWLCKNGKSKAICVHRLIAKTFLIKSNKDYTDINHINGNKQDNRVENLEWCMRSYNILHSYNHLIRKQKGVKVLCEETRVIYNTIKDATKSCGINYSIFRKKLYSENTKIGGYTWKILY